MGSKEGPRKGWREGLEVCWDLGAVILLLLLFCFVWPGEVVVAVAQGKHRVVLMGAVVW